MKRAGTIRMQRNGRRGRGGRLRVQLTPAGRLELDEVARTCIARGREILAALEIAPLPLVGNLDDVQSAPIGSGTVGEPTLGERATDANTVAPVRIELVEDRFAMPD